MIFVVRKSFYDKVMKSYGKKDYSHLTKVAMTDKNGHTRMVYRKLNKENKTVVHSEKTNDNKRMEIKENLIEDYDDGKTARWIINDNNVIEKIFLNKDEMKNAMYDRMDLSEKETRTKEKISKLENKDLSKFDEKEAFNFAREIAELNNMTTKGYGRTKDFVDSKIYDYKNKKIKELATLYKKNDWNVSLKKDNTDSLDIIYFINPTTNQQISFHGNFSDLDIADKGISFDGIYNSYLYQTNEEFENAKKLYANAEKFERAYIKYIGDIANKFVNKILEKKGYPHNPDAYAYAYANSKYDSKPLIDQKRLDDMTGLGNLVTYKNGNDRIRLTLQDQEEIGKKWKSYWSKNKVKIINKFLLQK